MTTTPFNGSALDAARHNLAWAKAHGASPERIALLEDNVAREAAR